MRVLIAGANGMLGHDLVEVKFNDMLIIFG
jgi:dTDP-4-dehydrorhamnose reductase